jgi:ribonuclease R
VVRRPPRGAPPTSPIRRYPDLEVHRAVKHLLRGGRPDTTGAAAESLQTKATTASARERAAIEVEREVVDLYRAILMTARIGEQFDATIVAVTAGGIYTSLDHPFVDVLVRYDALGPDHYEASEDQLSVVGLRSGDTLRLGDRIVVQIEDAAVLRRTVYARRVLPAGVAEKSYGRRGRRPRRAKTSAWDDTSRQAERGTFPGARAARPTGFTKPSGRTARGRSVRRYGPRRGKRRG